MQLAILVPIIAVLALPLEGFAQQKERLHRVGWLSSGPRPASGMPSAFETFRQALRDHGYREGDNVVIEQRYAEGRSERLGTLASELAALRVAVILATTTSAAVEARKVTDTIPIVMGSAANPIAAGLAKDLARPGGNVTGLTLETSDVTAKRLELLKQAVPRVRRIAAFYPGELGTFPVVLQWLQDIKDASRALDLEPQMVDLGQDPRRWSGVFASTAAEGITAAVILETSTYFAHSTLLAELALKHRLAMIFPFREQAEAGGLMAYGADVIDLHRRAAGYVAKILRGAKPADLPIEQPTKFELVINLGTAKRLGLAIPLPLRLRADRIID